MSGNTENNIILNLSIIYPVEHRPRSYVLKRLLYLLSIIAVSLKLQK